VLIGGTACSVLLNEEDLDFRATKDLDLVLVIEALDKEFARAFWNYVQLGKYKNRQQSTGKEVFYRFCHPEDLAFPIMLELFSRVPKAIQIEQPCHLTPIPVEDEVQSLSAILLDGGYYEWLMSGRCEVNALPVVDVGHLIPLKAKAWIDLRARRLAGDPVDKRDVQKHKTDIIRLSQILSAENPIPLPDPIRADMQRFLNLIVEEPEIPPKTLGIKRTSWADILQLLREVYGFSEVASSTTAGK
jgi:hypothetical protein